MKENSFVRRTEQSPSSILSTERYVYIDSSASSKGNLRKVQLCIPRKCMGQEERRQDHYLPLLNLQIHRNLQRGSRPSYHGSSSEYKTTETIVYVCVSVLGFIIIVCVGLRHYIGIPQDPSPELTERKEIMKDMTEEEKCTILEYIFNKQDAHEVKHIADSIQSMNESHTDSDDSKSIEEVKENDDSEDSDLTIDSDEKEDGSLNSDLSLDSSSLESSCKGCDAKLPTKEDVEQALNEEVCSICLETCGTHLKNNKVISPSNCSHKFHKECIMEWFLSQSSNLTCPDCRSQMFTVDELRAATIVLENAKKREATFIYRKFACCLK
ncbi:predicted protein [Chaetoceros tenuissimus]|uniref:RING-type domain-containing protein n=1 Tax=Chaetoceros tenuissimus TaxID=426638 RepID=A0AAD3CEU7_9STRA|nr:predicted protein [Chaetoceros tenuissimus]